MKKKIIITFSIILYLFLSYIVFCVLGFLSLIPSNISESDDVTYYNDLVERVEYLPSIEELNEYKNTIINIGIINLAISIGKI